MAFRRPGELVAFWTLCWILHKGLVEIGYAEAVGVQTQFPADNGGEEADWASSSRTDAFLAICPTQDRGRDAVLPERLVAEAPWSTGLLSSSRTLQSRAGRSIRK